MSAELFNLNGKIALVTGGSRGLGLYMAEGILAAGGAKVYISSRKAKACEEAVSELNTLAQKNGWKGRAYSLPADLGKREGCEKLFKDYSALESKLDILIANAGATWGQDLETHPDSAIGKVLDLNVRGVFSSVQLFHKLLAQSGTAEDPSRVLITGSTAGITPSMGGGTYGYAASKAGIHHVAKILSSELGPLNITVNTLAPGFFPSKMSNGLLERLGDNIVKGNPRKRLGVKEDIIGATVYLCSPAGNYINGVILPIDGGVHIRNRL
ncbi:probable NADP-dependent mannitol dehydrogenase [Trichomonascus vanleenenianus]|uniref:putative NADP-dependent mannitol dehydrogenase n=1 Tax=Trichomonascus vanleenenianus TaxID=2268995 RepID=UPI003EC99C1F